MTSLKTDQQCTQSRIPRSDAHQTLGIICFVTTNQSLFHFYDFRAELHKGCKFFLFRINYDTRGLAGFPRRSTTQAADRSDITIRNQICRQIRLTVSGRLLLIPVLTRIISRNTRDSDEKAIIDGSCRVETIIRTPKSIETKKAQNLPQAVFTFNSLCTP